ncbi:methyltransferase domain-containing protein [Rhizobium wenxiniae]|uniref:class I SAM-dependent methyltransferase n=1 Tax=Rhizobium wenxiniae TaxID=1737357 RepID=UPI001C6E0BF7|nr:class I SAM-dependent methyltransferase [Rhizobium wenxiniae]MBW9087801.1 methyltransferase domain-containing protein [Rhizobium wenxiniae]
MQNWSIKDDIRDYWSLRAQTYDASPGHGIARHAEIEAWSQLIRRHLGDGKDRKALDLACGTGVMTMLMHGLGFKVTGLDFTEPMMARARRKSDDANASIRFLTRDAEETMEPDNTYDVIITRHLVWMLTDPDKAFADWMRILKPGGRLLIIDGDFVRKHWLEKLIPLLDRVFGRQQDGHSLLTPEQWQHHERIVGQVHFNNGIRSDDTVQLFENAGFGELKIDTNLADIRRSRGIKLLSRKGLTSTLQHRFAISGQKPL